MPYNSSGVYTLPTGPRPTSGQTALASQVTTPIDDIASALSQALLRDGRAPMIGDLTLYRDGSSALHAVTKQQLDTKQNALGYTAENTANKGAANGYAALVNSKVPEANLPRGALDVTNHGLVGDDSTDNTAAFNALWATVKASGDPLYFPPGTYRFASSATIDFTGYHAKGGCFLGAGPGRSILRSMIASGVAFRFRGTSDTYDIAVRDIGFASAHDGCLVAIGNDDFSDPQNTLNMFNVAILNSYPGVNTEALRLNYVVNSSFVQVRANCYANGAGTNYGKALRARQVEFCSFVNGSYGNASNGVSFDDGISFCCSFENVDIENVNIAAHNTVATSGLHRFNGCQISLYTQYAIRSIAGRSDGVFRFSDCNFAPGGMGGAQFDTANMVGVILHSLENVATPAFPGFGAGNTYTNRTGRYIYVAYWGGAITSFTRNGAAIGLGAVGGFVLKPLDTVYFTGSGSSAWEFITLA